ncbi:DUF445 domain-containing protein [Alteribacillus sp. YIM 98480]|uniref:DUF445 domain-containing protein n=1 Tax=Alteribacillus sp. YIM 98480 TaxID=2606599 RepID=UPI00131D910C|nr:DUF445 family protein [Alteribacillus sp. YIM 98480]
MDGLWLIIIMIAVGAVIGGLTNSLAIKMLFRPYKPVYVGKWRVPFTPGLIPKRRGEMAEQMGKMVVNHLLTPEGIQKKIIKKSFRVKMTKWITDEITKSLYSSAAPTDFFQETWNVNNIRITLQEKTEYFIKEKLDRFIIENEHKEIKELLPIGVIEKGDELVPILARKVTKKGAEYFRGEEGRKQLYVLLEKFLQGKGSMLNFLGSMFGNDKIIEKLQPEIVRFFEDPASEAFIRDIIKKEWLKIQHKPFSTAASQIDTDKLAKKTADLLNKELPLFNYLDSPLHEWAPAFEEKITKQWIPGIIEQIQSFLADRLSNLFEQLELENVVRERVDTFSVDRLETMVLSISRREFKMITYLGALLGGLVGLFQGVFVILFL